MEVINTIFLVAMFLLAVWKLYDLFFYKDKVINLKKELKQVKYQLQVQTMANRTLSNFFAELTYRMVKDNKEYKQAPKPIYDWLKQTYAEWSKAKGLKK